MRFRWFLPACNIAIDVVLFGILVHDVDVYRLSLRHPPPLWRQEHQFVDPGLLSEGHVPEPLVAIMAGTPPAALIASVPLNNGWVASTAFDLRWASLYLVLASALWYAVGRWAETGHPKGMKLAKLYVLMRALSAPLSVSRWTRMGAQFSNLLLCLVWFAVALYVVLRTVRFLYRRVTSRPIRAA
jgi:hypothetical protein